MEYLIKVYSPPKSIVLDPFCGSGSTGVAAIQQDREFIGIDLSDNYCNISRERIDKADYIGEDQGIFSIGGYA